MFISNFKIQYFDLKKGMTVMKDVSIAKSEFLDGEKAITKIQDFW